MSLWTKLRDAGETAAVLTGNYFLPGSSLVTSKLASEGSQNQLNSKGGKLAQLGTGGAGAYNGQFSNYGDIGNSLGLSGGNTTGYNFNNLYGNGAMSAEPGTIDTSSLFNSGSPGSLFSGTSGAAGAGSAGGGGLWDTVGSMFGSGGGMGWGDVFKIAGNLGSGYMNAQAAKDAASTQADAQRQALALQEKMYNQQVALNAPFRELGLGAQNKLAGMLGVGGDKTSPEYGSLMKDFSMADYQADPGYAFRMSEGLKALDRSAAARGGLLSGATLKGAQRYGQDLASQEYQNAYNRYQTNRANKLNPLQSLGGLGQTASNTMGGYAGQYGQTAGAGLADIGAVKAAGQIGATNAITNAIGNAMGTYQDQQLANAMRNSQYNRGY